MCSDVRKFGAPSFYLMEDVARALHAAVQQQDATRVWLLLPCLQAQLQHQPPSLQDVDGLMQLVISTSSCAKGNAQVEEWLFMHACLSGQKSLGEKVSQHLLSCRPSMHPSWCFISSPPAARRSAHLSMLR